MSVLLDNNNITRYNTHMLTNISDTTLQIVSICSIVFALTLSFYAINSSLNHLHHRVDEIDRVIHKYLRKQK